jgi:hypothetical protein
MDQVIKPLNLDLQSGPESGQAIVEYVLLLAILVSMFSLVLGKLNNSDAFAKMKKPLEKDFAYTYRYGHPLARGQEDGGPKYISQYSGGENFRIFINPPINE